MLTEVVNSSPNPNDSTRLLPVAGTVGLLQCFAAWADTGSKHNFEVDTKYEHNRQQGRC